MKKIILLLFGLFALTTAQGQDLSAFTCSTPEECTAAVDSLLKDAKRAYKFVEFYNSGNRYYFSFKEADPADPDNPARVRAVFVKLEIGANPALEIKGTTVYRLAALRGKYLDLFPIWKKYFVPDADLEKLAKNGSSDYPDIEISYPDGGSRSFHFKSDSQDKAIWIIESFY